MAAFGTKNVHRAEATQQEIEDFLSIKEGLPCLDEKRAYPPIML